MERGNAAGGLEHVGLARIHGALQGLQGGTGRRGHGLVGASAWARSTMSWARAGAGLLASSALTSSPAIAVASRTVARMEGERCSVLSMTRLSRFSMDQANSAMSVAPTMRPEPLSVWNERRMPDSASVSSGFCSQAGNSLPIRGDLFPRLFYIESEQFGVDVDCLGADGRLRRSDAAWARPARTAAARRPGTHARARWRRHPPAAPWRHRPPDRAAAPWAPRAWASATAPSGRSGRCPACTRDPRGQPAASPCSTRG